MQSYEEIQDINFRKVGKQLAEKGCSQEEVMQYCKVNGMVADQILNGHHSRSPLWKTGVGLIELTGKFDVRLRQCVGDD